MCVSALECLQTSKGQEYKGQWSLTVSGRECQRWDSSEPHVHFYNTSDLFPDPSVYDAHNYCRNPPTPSTRPWCFTTDNETRWEYCPIFYCGEQSQCCVFGSVSCCPGVSLRITRYCDRGNTVPSSVAVSSVGRKEKDSKLSDQTGGRNTDESRMRLLTG